MNKGARHNPYSVTPQVNQQFCDNVTEIDLLTQVFGGSRNHALSAELFVKMLHNADIPVERFHENVLLKGTGDGLTKVEFAEELLHADCCLKVDKFIDMVRKYNM
jgi:hypothetical protein